MRLKVGDKVVDVVLHGKEVQVGDRRESVAFERSGPSSWRVNGRIVYAVRDGRVVSLHFDGRNYRIEEMAGGEAEEPAPGRFDPRLVAPMTGRIAKVNFKVGDVVPAGEPIVVVEAMKMEHALTSPAASRVREIRCVENDRVEVGQVLVLLSEPAVVP